MVENFEDGIEEESELALMAQFLSDETLHSLTGSSDLSTVRRLEIQVNAEDLLIRDLGHRIPNLTELKMSGSNIPSFRDLGISLTNLRVLWLSRSGLESLDGIAALPLLTELYISFNDVEELRPLCDCEMLNTVDLEGNNVSDEYELEPLSQLSSLTSLNLSDNPIASIDGYRSLLASSVPSLRVIDDLPLHAPSPPSPHSSEAPSSPSSSSSSFSYSFPASPPALGYEDARAADGAGGESSVAAGRERGGCRKAGWMEREGSATRSSGHEEDEEEAGGRGCQLEGRKEVEEMMSEIRQASSCQGSTREGVAEGESSERMMVIEGIKHARAGMDAITFMSSIQPPMHGGVIRPSTSASTATAASRSSTSTSSQNRPGTGTGTGSSGRVGGGGGGGGGGGSWLWASRPSTACIMSRPSSAAGMNRPMTGLVFGSPSTPGGRGVPGTAPSSADKGWYFANKWGAGGEGEGAGSEGGGARRGLSFGGAGGGAGGVGGGMVECGGGGDSGSDLTQGEIVFCGSMTRRLREHRVDAMVRQHEVRLREMEARNNSADGSGEEVLGPGTTRDEGNQVRTKPIGMEEVLVELRSWKVGMANAMVHAEARWDQMHCEEAGVIQEGREIGAGRCDRLVIDYDDE